jgi:hypothetical protein
MIDANLWFDMTKFFAFDQTIISPVSFRTSGLEIAWE